MDLRNLLPLFEPAVAPVRSRIHAGGRVVAGVPDGAKAAVVATLADRPVLLVAGKSDRADAWCEELTAWLGDPDRVVFFPESEGIPYERISTDAEAEEGRLTALQHLRGWSRPEPPVIVTGALALAQPTIAKSRLERGTERIRAGERLKLEGFVRRLERLGYEFGALVEGPGQAARRGGIVDVFPPDAEQPLRVEFWGDEVESIRRFQPGTQRAVEKLTEAVISPAREALVEPEQIDALRATLDFSAVTEDERPRLVEELDALARGEAQGLGFWAPFLSTGSLLDHLPPDILVITDQAHDLGLLLDELDRQTAAARAEAEAAGLIPRGLPLPHRPRAEVMGALGARRPLVDLQRWAVPVEPAPPLEDDAPKGRRRRKAEPSRNGKSANGTVAASAAQDATADTPASPDTGSGVTWAEDAAGAAAEGDVIALPFGTAASFGGRLRSVFSDIAARLRGGRRVVVTSLQSARLAELFASEGLLTGFSERVEETPPPGALTLVHGALAHGWTLDLPDGGLVLVTDAEIFGFTKQRRAVKHRGTGREAFLAGLSPGDFVVHVDHGIGRFAGLVRRTVDGVEREYLELRYAERDRLFVPTDQVDRVDRYVGPSDHTPQLTRLSSGEWARTKERVRRAISDMAQELLQLYAERELQPGHAFNEDTPWQQEMEGAFPFVETPDQLTAIREIKGDMEQPRPMDRVLVGDVGYGKTEVAVRAAFKAVMDGKQVAVLAPTTVLAQQHFQTFTERTAGFPVRVELLSRFRSEEDARRVIAEMAEGKVDIVVGTHRLLSKSVKFRDLGLVVIDEEQRFGVVHKEWLRRIRASVDVLTLSATPIPRTLHMALSGIRDMSTITTAPEDRLPVKTFVSEWDERLIREALLREIDRGGQAYIVHNRVYNIELIARKIRELVPEAEVLIGHGQMPEEQLERTMVRFQRGEADVLVCTTIIESGLDIPNVNTIIINQADRLGLSQLYQLRGRVGRGAHRAYAYLLYDRNTALSETAQKRLQTIFEATELGAGFQIAMKDLEIRGAGNLLGAEQSGHIGAIGYELYSRMLAETVTRMRALQRGETPPPPPPPPVTVDLPLPAHIPEHYIPDLNLRLAMYQRLGQVATPEAAEEVAAEFVDRFGEPPPVVGHLLELVRVKAYARRIGLTSINVEDGAIVLRAPRPIPFRERVTAQHRDGVQVGSAQIRIEQRGDWRAVLRSVLDLLDPERQPKPEDKPSRPDFGTFAPESRRPTPAPAPTRARGRDRHPREERPRRRGWPGR